jgi:hypothetical protein
MNSTQFQEFQRIEPRLAEYYLRKKFNKKNNIEDIGVLDRTYQITSYDIKVINDFIKTGTVTSKNLETQLMCDYVELPKEKHKFESEELMNDYRFQRLKKKYDLDKNANVARDDISNLSRNYNDFVSDYNCSENNDTINNSSRINIDTKYQTYDNPYILNKEKPTNEKLFKREHSQSNIQLNQVVYDNQYNSYQKHEPTLDNILTKTRKYKDFINSTNDYTKPSDYEDLARLNLNNLNNCISQEDSTVKNINIENYIKYGNPTSKAKSLGFENPVEHFFQYIDDSIQDPDHVCFDRPQMTRTMNRKSFRSGSNW